MRGWIARWRKARVAKALSDARGDLAHVTLCLKGTSRNDLTEVYLDHQTRRAAELKARVHTLECRLQDLP